MLHSNMCSIDWRPADDTHSRSRTHLGVDRRRPTGALGVAWHRIPGDRSPTPLLEPVIHDALTHPATKLAGWRFQGTSVVDGDTRIFDVRPVDRTRWELLAVYA